MAKSALQVMGDLVAVQKKHSLDRLGAFDKLGFVLCLLSHGYWTFEAPTGDPKQVERLSEIGRDCKAVGLDVEEENAEMRDNSWSHSGSNYISCVKLTVRLPISPAMKVLYGKSDKV